MADLTSTQVAGCARSRALLRSLRRFAQIQKAACAAGRAGLVSDPRIPQTVVVVPSLTLDLEDWPRSPACTTTRNASCAC